MNVFHLRDDIVNEYRSFVESFVSTSTDDVAREVQDHFERGRLWPQPLVQLNPTFQAGAWIDDLVDQDLLHNQCREIFRIHKDSGKASLGQPLRLHRHQEEAIRRARTGANYVLTTGTGSGKSLAYIIPIVDHVLRNGGGKGIQAVVVYPMNALANSQKEELEKFLGKEHPPVRFAAYTGQEDQDRRDELLEDPPDILLTNYVMLELILTRHQERRFRTLSRDLRFIVLDELHTYRGRQGSDVAMLVRRVRQAFRVEDVQHVGTSATLAGPGSFAEQQEEVAEVASKLFGVTVMPQNIVGETLESTTEEPQTESREYREELTRVLAANEYPESLGDYFTHPLSSWIEWHIGLDREAGGNRLRRRGARPISGRGSAAEELAELTGLDETTCATKLRSHLMIGYDLGESARAGEADDLKTDDVQGDGNANHTQPFAFRLHQFISRGDTVYATPEPPEKRHVTVHGQQFVPNDRSRRLFPVVFCRECGQEYYPVYRVGSSAGGVLEPRDLNDRSDDGSATAGYLYISTDHPWPEDQEEVYDRLPEEYLEVDSGGRRRVTKSRKKYVPELLSVTPDGKVVTSEGTGAAFAPAPFRFCLHCGSSFGSHQRGDFPKLGSLATEGRSSATTVLSSSAVSLLRTEQTLPQEARKLLSFTDNRQDASLQTGHFNDFLQVALLRGALYHAMAGAGEGELLHDSLVSRVFEALPLTPHDYAVSPEALEPVLDDARKALRDVLGYLIYRDQERGWRITAPNLEQVGLLQFAYRGIRQLVQEDARWQESHPALRDASPETRETIVRALLDWFRRDLAVKVDYLSSSYQEGMKQRSSQHLAGTWALDPEEELQTYRRVVLGPRPKKGKTPDGLRYLSRRSSFAQFLRRNTVFPHLPDKLSTEESGTVLEDLVRVLTTGGLLVQEAVDRAGTSGHVIPGAALQWIAGDGTKGFHDPIRRPSVPEGGTATNHYFRDLYRDRLHRLKGLRASEHTAQVPNDKRQEREGEFKNAQLPVLYASPTLELGVDIKELNVVNMRNVPPTPANYAQRSGRAGRNGQPALVLTYCSTFQSHDQYFFKRPALMVSGAVSPPRIDLLNEELLKAHTHSIWLAEIDEKLPSSVGGLVTIDDDPEYGKMELPLRHEFSRKLADGGAKTRTLQKARSMLEAQQDKLREQPWYRDDWLDRVVQAAPREFNEALDRWRELYRAAKRQREFQHAIQGDQSRPKQQRDRAKALRRQAESQIELLTQQRSFMEGDFYTYRYLASEGFLPGYNFPRLPVTAYLPGEGRRTRFGGGDEFLSRPRFLAISEFGPQALIYHEGARYRISTLMLPLQEDQPDLPLASIKVCDSCGYLHQVHSGSDPDVCEQCGSTLPGARGNLIQMTHVGTRRAQRITSDEEERQRRGYEILTAVRYAHTRLGSQVYRATVEQEGSPLLHMEYGHSANLWRINLGWRRRDHREPLDQGFKLDVERGDWLSETRAREIEEPGTDEESVPIKERRIETVIPYVQDTRNALVLDPVLDDADPELRTRKMASLQSALKRAIQARFDLEEAELAAEPLPRRQDRRRILLYEASEGGAGVLQRLLSEPEAIGKVAEKALELLHYDPNTGADQRRGPSSEEDCEAACYDCLMTYGNQMDHPLLDRTTIRDYLRELAAGTVGPVQGPTEPQEHYGGLYDQCDSKLEREWLTYLEERGLNLPSRAQVRINDCSTQADFFYDSHDTAVYIDGPPHDYPSRQGRDREQELCLEEAGYFVIRFGNSMDWDAVIAEYPSVFGSPS